MPEINANPSGNKWCLMIKIMLAAYNYFKNI